jgi:ubiquitin carboxyl-terminal hydrolase 5/13
LQLLFSGNVIPELVHRYGVSSNASADIAQHVFLTSQTPKQAPDDILAQTTKVARALTSGVFAAPLPEEDGDDDDSNNPKYRLSPRMIKHIMGKNHVEFCTGHQQDAAEYLLHFLEKLDRAEKAAASKLATTSDSSSPIVQRLVGKTTSTDANEEDAASSKQQTFVASQLFAFETCTRSVCSADEKVKYRKNPREIIFTLRIPMDKAVVPTDSGAAGSGGPDQKRLKPDTATANTDGGDKQEEAKGEEEKVVLTVPFMSCVDQWAADEAVSGVSWDHLNKSIHNAIQQTRFQNFPRYLLVHMQRYYVGPGWTEVKLEVKLEVNIDMPKQGEEIEIDLTPYKIKKEEGEVLVPESNNDASDKTTASAPAPAAAPSPPVDEMALSQLYVCFTYDRVLLLAYN